MLMICPNTRMDEASPEATPYWLLSTELMRVFMLGDEKSAKPIPTQMRMAMMIPNGVLGPKKASMANPVEHMAIPAVAK